MNNYHEFFQAIQATPCGSVITELYSAAQEIVSDYIENGEEADETFFKALKVIVLIEDGESQKALEVGLNY
ncbi:hypothetical protein D3C85_1374480 [compost metagenome]